MDKKDMWNKTDN